MISTPAQVALQQFIDLVPFPSLGHMHNYKLEYAIEEAGESFLREKKPAGKYTYKNSEIFFVDETLLNAEQKELFKRVPKRAVDIPSIYTLFTDAVKNIPVKLELFYAEEMDNAIKK